MPNKTAAVCSLGGRKELQLLSKNKMVEVLLLKEKRATGAKYTETIFVTCIQNAILLTMFAGQRTSIPENQRQKSQEP